MKNHTKRNIAALAFQATIISINVTVLISALIVIDMILFEILLGWEPVLTFSSIQRFTILIIASGYSLVSENILATMAVIGMKLEENAQPDKEETDSKDPEHNP